MREYSYRDLLKVAVSIALPIVFWFLPLTLEPKTQHAIAITIFMILA